MADDQRQNILVLTHNFPRFANDISGIGFQPLYQNLSRKVKLHFVVPHDAGLKDHETVNGLDVHRFHYASDDRETLAYRGDMHKRVLTSPFVALGFIKSYLEKALEIAAAVKPQTIWAHWLIPGGIVARKISAQTGIPFVVTCHGTDIHLLKKFPLMKPVARRVFNEAKTINVVSNFLKQSLIEALGDEFAGNIRVAPLVVDTAHIHFDSTHPRRQGSIISASRYTKQKNLDVLLRAVGRLKAGGVGCSLDLHGSGPEENALKLLAGQLDLGAIVRFLPSVTQAELANRYRESEIICLVSEREGFGLMLVEAMMCGCVAVGAASGGITDIITQDGEDGLLVPPRNVDALAEALKKLLTDRVLLEALATKGRLSIERRFSAEAITAEFVGMLSD